MRYFLAAALALLITSLSYSQTGQINIARIDLMPNTPAPYLLRNWKQVAKSYDAFVFNRNLSGTWLPVLTLKSSGRNYPELQPIQLDTYVGTASETQAEAINIIPAIVGASLVGIDKSSQNGTNWVEKIKDFYNSANGQNVYLNGSNTTSGNDWWYDVMPNVFFYQAYDLYKDIPGFDHQFTTVADRWLSAVEAMGGKATPWTVPDMNYRAWNLATMTGNTNGVREPEASGAIGWLLYNAYRVTGEKKYLEGAQMCLEYLSGLTTNPSYELQLPYGTLAAAKLNAELGTGYDVSKMLDWSFERGPLRGWGTIVGKWDGKDISGLTGEANDAGNDYAFMMNGYQQAAALVPLARYDKRFARAIAKWVLNLANASRYYYPQFLAPDRQDDYTWSNTHDPESVIGYEALKEKWDNKALYGTGDAKRSGWAATNLALYGSSHVGYLAAIVEPTNVEQVLRLDLHATDFFADRTFPSFMIFNPFQSSVEVTLNEGAGPYDVYDAVSETTVIENASGNFTINIAANEVLVLTLVPAGTELVEKNGKLFAGDHVIDHHHGYDFSPDFRIKSLAVNKPLVEYNDPVEVYATVENAPEGVKYLWYVNEELYLETTLPQLTWTAPQSEGPQEIRVEVKAGEKTLMDSVTVAVVSIIEENPVILSTTTDKKFYLTGDDARIIVLVDDAETEEFSYEWTVTGGDFVQDDSLLVWTAPEQGLYTIRCKVTNVFGLITEVAVSILVKAISSGDTEPVAYYPLDTDVKDYSGNNYDGEVEGTQQAADAGGVPNQAYRFSSGNDVIHIENRTGLNFRNEITVAFWMSPGMVAHEAFLLSHGSWEERWKVSITPDKKLRWTVKTAIAVRDLDSTLPVVANSYVHVTLTYTGYSMEMYFDGELNTYLPHAGLILTSGKSITMGQKDYSDRQYYYNGVRDEVRIYDKALQPDEILLLKDMWYDGVPAAIRPVEDVNVSVFPNPAYDGSFWISGENITIRKVDVISPEGRELPLHQAESGDKTLVQPMSEIRGLCIVRIQTSRGVTYRKILFR